MKNNTKYAEQIKAGDNIIISGDDIQEVKSVAFSGKKNICVEFIDGRSIIFGLTTQIPVIEMHSEVIQTIEEMYNLILDDDISLVDFTAWCKKIKKSA